MFSNTTMSNNQHSDQAKTTARQSKRMGPLELASFMNNAKGVKFTRATLLEAFPELNPRRLAIILEKACEKGLIHSLDRGVYAGGTKEEAESLLLIQEPRPAAVREGNTLRYITVADPKAIDTGSLIKNALGRMSTIERAWFTVASSTSSHGASMA